MEVDTGMSEVAYADRLYEMVVRLEDSADADWLGLEFPEGFMAYIDEYGTEELEAIHGSTALPIARSRFSPRAPLP